MNPIAGYRERVRAKLLEDFGAFCRRAWKEIEPNRELQWSWHHQLVSEFLQLAFAREELRLIFTMPPRGLKSRLVSVFFPAWCWAQRPGESFILCSYSDSLSEELNIVRRNLLMSRWFQETFPNRVLFKSDLNRREQFANVSGGQMIATSTEGTLTGKGADYLIVDDLVSPQQSFSDLLRNNANRFFDSTLRSRLNDPMTGCIIVVCQRLHEADLVGHLNQAEPGVWTTVSLPMEAEQDEEIVFPVSGRVLHRKQGDLLHPARWSVAWIGTQKKTIGPFIWSSQFQQRPAPAGGAIFKNEWFQTYKKEPDKGSTIISLDTAFSVKKSADYSAATVWTALEGRYYLRFVWRERVAYPDLKRMVEELADVWAPDSVLVEEKASGLSLLQSLKQETSLPVVGIPVDIDKVSRAHSVTALFSAGRVFFPEDAPWLPTFLHELELFPGSAFDDQVDSIVQALTYLRSRQYDGGLGLLDALKDFFTGKRKMPRAVNEIVWSTPVQDSKPVETRVEGFKRWLETGKAPPCYRAECGSSATGYIAGGVHLCKRCAAQDGVVPMIFAVGSKCPVTECALSLQSSGGTLRCQNHGQPPDNGNRPQGVTFAQYNRRRDRFR